MRQLRSQVSRWETVEVRFPDGRPSRYFYFEDLPGRRLREQLTSEEAKREAIALARRERG
jgi:hypothetical protein